MLAVVSGAWGKDLGGGWQEKKKDDGRVVQELKIEAPTFTEEDQYGYNMPDRYRCDSCRAVMFHLDAELSKRHPKSRRLKQWEYADLFDETCRNAFQGYGVKLVNGENALSGPGLRAAEDLAPGSGAIQMGGESWTKRLGEICRKIVYDKIGEEELYEKFYERHRAEEQGDDTSGLGINEELCYSEVRECTKGPKLPPKPKEAPEQKDKKAKPAKDKAAKAKEGKAKAKKNEVSPQAQTQASAAAAPEERLDVQSFLRKLAVRHGLTSDEYLTARTEREWERLTVAMAGRIFGQFADNGASGNCPASR